MQRPLSTAQKICWRHASSSAQARPSKAAPVGGTLPPHKLRALISLYHQADTFITPENLSQRIDEAFIPSLRDDNNLSVNMFASTMTHVRELGKITPKQLREALEEQRNAPKVMEPEIGTRSPGIYDTGTWSSERKGREKKVMEALYGVEGVGSAKVLPGLDVLLEERERVEKDIKADEDGEDGR